MLSRFLILLSVIIIFPGCRKEEINTVSTRQISIISAKATSLKTFDIQLKINLAEENVFKGAELHFEDITVVSDSSFSISVPSSFVNKTDTISVSTNRLNHDFLVTAILYTDKGEFRSEKVAVRALKNTFRVYMLGTTGYEDPGGQIEMFFNRKYYFTFLVDYINYFKPVTVGLKINDIPMDCNIDFSNPSCGTCLTVFGSTKLPADFPAGSYNVHLFLDSMEFISEKKFNVPEGFWTRFDTVFSGQKFIDRTWFVVDDILYFTGGHFPLSPSLIDNHLYKFNLKTRQYLAKSVLSFLGSTNQEILPYNLQYDNNGYILHAHDTTVQLLKYNSNNESWTCVTTSPLKRSYGMYSFIIGNKLYLGSGLDDDQFLHSFWSYDFITGEWHRLNDSPCTGATSYVACCVADGKAFVFQQTRYLWKYDPAYDNWLLLPLFPGPRRISTNLVSYGKDVYLIGGNNYENSSWYHDDCWRYNSKTGKWEIMAFLPDWQGIGISFTYSDKIYTGYAFTPQLQDILRPDLFQFIP